MNKREKGDIYNIRYMLMQKNNYTKAIYTKYYYIKNVYYSYYVMYYYIDMY
jgi:hypothetical protein